MPLPREVWESEDYSAWIEHLNSCSNCGDWYLQRQVEERGVNVEEFSCVHIAYHSTYRCEIHDDPWECPDMTLVKTSVGFGIPVRDGGNSSIEIEFCPWCGTKIKE